MSVEAPKTVEETPVVDATKAVPEAPEPSVAPVETSVAPVEATSTVESTPAVGAEETAAAPAATEELKKDETVVEAVPTSEGTLGYKEPGFFKKFIYTKHFFWVSDEASTAESLAAFLRQEKEKADTKHTSAAWARESGKGLLFYAKRSEDKAAPAGIINLSEASAVTKEGLQQFSFRVGTHQHRFEATNSKERDSWIVAIEKAIGEGKELKDELVERESYKKNVEDYSKPTIIAAAAVPKSSRSKSKEPKKSLDAVTATAAATPAPVAAETASTSSSSSDEATKAAKKDKERSQSRKRGSIFGSLLGKKEEHAEKKEEKAEIKKELKEEKKIEAEEKKEEAKVADEPTATKNVEAAEASTAAAAIATVPATVAVAAASDKKEEEDETTATPTGKKAKRGSVFGSLFKKSVTSPTTEKTEKDATTSDIPPVSETAPKLDEPIENKPIDTAAVTAPADNVETPAATSVDATKDTTTPVAETTTAQKAEKKGGLLGFINKKTEKKEPKEEAKEDHAAKVIAEDPVAAAAVPETTTEATVVEPTTETATKEERPGRENPRRTSLFFKNKKNHQRW